MDLREQIDDESTRHPWESARLRFVLDTIAPLACPAPRVLDVGCGDGYVARSVLHTLPGSNVVAIDTELTDEALSSDTNGLRFVNRWQDISTAAFDLALLLDVIEHVEDDSAFLRQVLDKLDPRAHVLVTVPAFSQLFGAHDRFLGHYRRYDHAQLLQLLQAAGLHVDRSGYLFLSPMIARIATLVVERTVGTRQELRGVGGWHHGPVLTGLIQRYLHAENKLMQAAQTLSLRLPGLSVWALCSR